LSCDFSAFPPSYLIRLRDLLTEGCPRDTTAKPTRANRTITVDCQNETTYLPRLGAGKAFVECVRAFLLARGFQLAHKTPWQGGGCLTRHSPDVRVRLGGLPIWRLHCPTCRAGCTGLPHFIWHYRHRRPEVARDALLAPHGGRRLALGAHSCSISPMVLYGIVKLLTILPSPCHNTRSHTPSRPAPT
jgi:hypothetical protein